MNYYGKQKQINTDKAYNVSKKMIDQKQVLRPVLHHENTPI